MQKLGAFPWRIMDLGVGVGQDGTQGAGKGMEEEKRKRNQWINWILPVSLSCISGGRVYVSLGIVEAPFHHTP